MDVDLFYKHIVNSDNRLANIGWIDLIGHCFGDVMIFDTTYKTYIYGKSLVMLIGIDHHYRTIFVLMALVVDEIIDAYT